MMAHRVTEECGWNEDGVHAALESRVSRNWRRDLVITLAETCCFPWPIAAKLLSAFCKIEPCPAPKSLAGFVVRVDLARAGHGVTQAAYVDILSIFWRLPHGSWCAAIQPPPRDHMVFKSLRENTGFIHFVRPDGAEVHRLPTQHFPKKKEAA